MSETILNALVQLFALIGDIHDDTIVTSREKDIVRSFLARHLNNELVKRYMKIFEDYLSLYNSERAGKDSLIDRKKTTLNAMRILGICEKINQELEQRQKVYVLVQLTDYISLGTEITENELDFLQSVADAFHVPAAEYANILSFIMKSPAHVPDKKKVLVLQETGQAENAEINYLRRDNFRGILAFIHIQSTNTYILRYRGSADLYLNGQNITSDQTYIFDQGSSIRAAGIKTIFYTEVVGLVTGALFEERVILSARDVTFRFRNSENGIHDLNMLEELGMLVGILGGSGVGKSTTLSILNGTLKPQSGTVTINGWNLYDENEKENLKGVIGFVPQDDLLIEELTVFQNLYYNARLCMNHLPEKKIVEVVNKTLSDFDLEETRDLKVGSPLKKIISGGQRKRVNIALELMREPTILFVDEPTSGLSSVDSEIVMNLLKAQTYKGKLVIINIHQPGSNIYKMFDRIMIIDKGGYQVYYGNPTEAIVYFKRHSRHANPEEDQCVQCGNIDTDQILQIVESKVVDERGRATRIRKVSPAEWAERLRESGMIQYPGDNGKKKLPENNFSIPGLLKQSVIFFRRDLLSKLSDMQYIVITLLGPPLLAFLLAYFTRYTANGAYVFSENENVPAYIFMCVITSLFFGLMVSSEEIIKDRKLLKRESFLNLSWFSYLNSKIMIVFIISALQTLSFVLIGNTILSIKGMTFPYWLVLFTTACFSNILGLNLSSAFNSVITIYIIIPFIIIPQLLFSGVLVQFDKLHIGYETEREYVPVIGDLMTARWSFEAIAVKQFRDNKYQSNFVVDKIALTKADSYTDIIDELNKDIIYCVKYEKNNEDKPIVEEKYRLLNKYIDMLSEVAGEKPGSWKDNLKINSGDRELEKNTRSFLEVLRRHFTAEMSAANKKMEATLLGLVNTMGADKYNSFVDAYDNHELNRMMTLEPYLDDRVVKIDDRLVYKPNPIFMKATSGYGRAHFYAPYKFIGRLEIDTFVFNLVVIWLVTCILYVVLYYKLLYRLLDYLGNLRLPKSEA
jgi:ABC-type multidrug transport system ATPase subunit